MYCFLPISHETGLVPSVYSSWCGNSLENSWTPAQPLLFWCPSKRLVSTVLQWVMPSSCQGHMMTSGHAFPCTTMQDPTVFLGGLLSLDSEQKSPSKNERLHPEHMALAPDMVTGAELHQTHSASPSSSGSSKYLYSLISFFKQNRSGQLMGEGKKEFQHAPLKPGPYNGVQLQEQSRSCRWRDSRLNGSSNG